MWLAYFSIGVFFPLRENPVTMENLAGQPEGFSTGEPMGDFQERSGNSENCFQRSGSGSEFSRSSLALRRAYEESDARDNQKH